METNLLRLPKKLAVCITLMYFGCVSAFAGGNTIDSGLAYVHIVNAITAGDAPNGVYVLPLGAKASGDVHIESGTNGSNRRIALSNWTSTGTINENYHDCPPFCRQISIDNKAIPGELLEYTKAHENSGLSNSDVNRITAGLEAETIDRFTIPASAIDWLRHQGADFVEIARGRDLENNCELIIAGFDRNGVHVGNGVFYVVPVVCPRQ